MNTTQSIDPEAIENLRSLSPNDDDGFLKEILTIFLSDTPLRIADLYKFRADGNVEAFIRTAHTIKGSSSNVGATEIHDLSEKIEKTSRLNGLTLQENQLKELAEAFDRAKVIIEKISS
jgi:HPt (histidine-containing phosphotransfer) domain-containing protein